MPAAGVCGTHRFVAGIGVAVGVKVSVEVGVIVGVGVSVGVFVGGVGPLQAQRRQSSVSPGLHTGMLAFGTHW